LIFTDSSLGAETPALATSASSTPPVRSVISAATRSTDEGSPRSPVTSPSCRSTRITVSPAASSCAAVACPIPEAAPVTTTVRDMSSPFAVAVHCFTVHCQRRAQRRRRSRRKSRPRPAAAYASAMTGLLCLALGTTSAKAALLALSGRTRAAASAEYPTRHTADGGAEQDPADWVRAARTAIARTLPPAAEVAALCLTGQMQDLVLEGDIDADSASAAATPAVDSAGSPAAGSAAEPARDPAVHPAVLYTDLRAAAETAQLRTALARDGVDWDALAGNLQDASSCAAMFHRLARH